MANPRHPKFQDSEFACKCGQCGKGFADMRMTALTKLYAIREDVGFPLKLLSAFRCEAHNKAEGGADNSAHLRGYALDVRYNTMEEGYALLASAIKHGFFRIGINYKHKFIHMDCDPLLPKGLFPY